jgi:hypothetical protein
MNDISYVTVSKNDNYDKDNVQKIIMSLNNNVQQLIDRGMETEVILVDWCSDVPFHTLDRIKNEVKVPVKHIYVDKSIPNRDGLNPERFYEYFAKNIGVRRATNRYILLENTDMLNDDELSDSIVKMVKDDLKNVYGRPGIRVNVWLPNIDEYTHYDTIDDKPLGDLNPGDFMFASKEAWEIARGYDETNITHRTKFRQVDMDVEILFQFVRHGINVHFLQGYYRHMDHERGNMTHQEKFGNSVRNTNGYHNTTNWGCVDVQTEKKDDVLRLFV